MNDIVFAAEHRRRPRGGFFKRMLWSAAGSCALGGLLSWRLNHHWMRIERLEMPLRGLGRGFEGKRLAHISDLHCSPIVRERYLHRCVELVNSLDVDFVAVTGDLLTGPREYARRAARVLGQLTPRVAALACLGNHDYGLWHPRGLGGDRGMGRYVADLLALADVFVMANESRTFRLGGSALQFVGLEDYWTPHYDPDRAFEWIDPDSPTVALCHNPDPAEDLARRGAQWVLAGHTHGNEAGERSVKALAMPTDRKHFVGGRYSLADGGQLYVNRGLGYARRMNLNSRPEITVFTLRRAP